MLFIFTLQIFNMTPRAQNRGLGDFLFSVVLFQDFFVLFCLFCSCVSA